MVSSLPFDAIENPTDALCDLYNDLKDVGPDAFPSRVTTHFTSLFAAPDAFEKVICLASLLAIALTADVRFLL